MMLSRRILVTGASGFVGSVLVRRLLSEGHKVSIFIRENTDTWRLNDIISCVEVYKLDLCDKNAVSAAVKEINPQIIFHLAANVASPSLSCANEDISVNVIGTWNLLSSLSNFRYELFVNAGSSSEYGFKNFSMREDDFLEPNSYHSFAKGSQTLLCQCCAKVEKKPIVTLRFFSVYGPFEKKTRLIPYIIRSCLENSPLNLSRPKICRDFIYVDDVIDCCMRFDHLELLGGQIFNVGTGIQTPISKVVENVFELMGVSVPCIWNKNDRAWDTENWVADCSKSHIFLDWDSKIDLKTGLKKTIEWTKEKMHV